MHDPSPNARPPAVEHDLADVGAVVIGRNEGDRLKQCLRSIVGELPRVVYVDSGSTDGSVAFAESLGVEVVDLDLSRPFTMARARNAGVEQLVRSEPTLRYVQFVDGDCEIRGGWLEAARATFAVRADAAVVCGRCRERHPEHSIYNRLCDMELDTPVGEIASSGGNAMMRLEPFRTEGGFRAELIAGEEPELCLRLRQQGWTVLRIDHEMAWHDAAMTRFGQWWRRSVRGGHAYAEGAWLHGRSPERYRVREVVSIAGYAALAPMAVMVAPLTHGASLAALLVYPLLYWRVRRHRLRHGDDRRAASLYARFCVIGKFAEAMGMLKFLVGRKMMRRGSRLIEYKQPAHAETATRRTG